MMVNLSFGENKVPSKAGYHLYDVDHDITVVDFSFDTIPQTPFRFLKYMVKESKNPKLKEAIRYVYRNKKEIIIADQTFNWDEYAFLFVDEKPQDNSFQVIEMDSMGNENSN